MTAARALTDASRAPTPVTRCDAAVIGAGPYGLSTAAHLIARGLTVEVFGKPLELWRDHMPRGMRLRSHWWATNLSDPHGNYGFARFLDGSGLRGQYPLPIDAFIEYGLWFQARAVPHVTERYIASVTRADGGFLLTRDDGLRLQARTVVMATGLSAYANRAAADGWPARAVSHTMDHRDLGAFVGETVAVVGAGQSAIESAALLVEAGAKVHVVARHPIHWLSPDRDESRGLMERLLAPRNGIAPGWKNWALERAPYLFYRAPQAKKDRWNDRYYLSAASDWLRTRVMGKAALHENAAVTRAEETGDRARLTLSDGTVIADAHVLLATGYRVDVNRLTMIDLDLRAEIATHGGVPTLSASFESSVSGLYFVGFTSLRAFGPLYRFVAGCPAAARRVARAVGRSGIRVRARRPLRAWESLAD